jgi:PKD repeat protein
VPFSVKFVDTSSLSPTNWSWNFGDGSISHEMNPVHTYVSPGTYSVKLIASNEAGGNSVTRIYYITVMPEFQAPIAAFGISPQQPQSDTIQFVDQSNGPAANWSWNFGDGGISVLQNPVHTFSGPGNYMVTLTVSNPLGRSNSLKYLTLGGAPGTSSSSSASNLGNTFSDAGTYDYANGGNYYQQNW